MVRVLDEEIDRLDSYLSILTPPSIDTLYIGGGTPSVVPAPILQSFLERIFTRLPCIPIESTIEVNPESLSIEFLQVILSFPINRLSIGIQTFKNTFFKIFDRCSSPEINLTALEIVQKQWDRRFSIDLLYGFPGSTIQEALADLAEAVRYRPHHISLYQITPEEHTKYGEQIQKGKLKPLSNIQEEKMRRALLRRSRDFGFQQYEISNLALPGEKCRHNLRYWELRPYLGIGPSAVSTLPGKDNRIVRLTEKPDISNYVEQNTNINTIEVEEILPDIFMKEVFLMGLRMVQGIKRDSFRRMFGLSIEEVVPRTIQTHARLIALNEEYCSLTERGRLWLNRILVDLFNEIDQYPNPIRCVWPL